MAHTVAMGLEGEEGDQEYYGAGLENVLSSAGIVSSPAIPLPDHDPIDHTGVGVHVSGVFTKPIVVEDSLWGDPLEDKKKKNGDVLLCDLHGKVCSKGICKVYEKQLREHQKKSKEEKEAQNRRNVTGGPNDGRDARGGRGAGRETRGAPPRGRGGVWKDSGPRPATDGEFGREFFSREPRLNRLLSPKPRLLKRLTAPLLHGTRGLNPAITRRVLQLGELATKRGVRARWTSLPNPSENLTPSQA